MNERVTCFAQIRVGSRHSMQKGTRSFIPGSARRFIRRLVHRRHIREGGSLAGGGRRLRDTDY